jgi:uncharacterized SAM-binding protein YcdF (DUF218 family)
MINIDSGNRGHALKGRIFLSWTLDRYACYLVWMLFIASKIVWMFLKPSKVLMWGVGFGAGLASTPSVRAVRVGRLLLRVAGGALVVCALTPLCVLIARPLEDAVARPRLEQIGDPKGIIILGGAIDSALTQARGPTALTSSGARVTEGVALAKIYPRALLVFSGGSANLVGKQMPEGEAALDLLVRLGLSRDRIVIERRSRNTFENGRFARELLDPRPGERWILVTSALHMPRALGVFEKAGFEVSPYPVAYLTAGEPVDYWNFTFSPFIALPLLDVSAKEWIGLAAYWLMGRTDRFLPSPPLPGRSAAIRGEGAE